MALQPSSVYKLSYSDESLWNRGDLSIEGIYKAWKERRDPRLAEYIVKLAQLDPKPTGYDQAQKSGVFVYDSLLSELSPWRLYQAIQAKCKAKGISLRFGEIKRSSLREINAQVQGELWAKLEEQAQNPEWYPERLKLHEVLMALYKSPQGFARQSLLEVIREIPLKYGPWKAIKAIYKQSIRNRDWVMFGAIAARIDIASTQSSGYRSGPNNPFSVSWRASQGDVSQRTLKYLSRLGWRVLRGLQIHQPALYPEVACEVLKNYPPNSHRSWGGHYWIFNHILFHEAKGYYGPKKRAYGAENFYVSYRNGFYGNHAYPELWPRGYTPLLNLLLNTEHQGIFDFAHKALFDLFKKELSDLDAAWVMRAVSLKRALLDEWVVQWLSEICKTSQKDYKKMNLHRPLFVLLFSKSSKASTYALTYFQAHVDVLVDLIQVRQAMALVRNSSKDLRALGENLLDPKSGYFTLGLEEWTDLLCDAQSHDFAAKHIKALFSSIDLTFEWYSRCLNSDLDKVAEFASALLKNPQYRPAEGNLLDFYWSLLTPKSWRSKNKKLAFDGLESLVNEAGSNEEDSSTQERFLNQLNREQYIALLLHPERDGRKQLTHWVKKKWLDPQVFEQSFLIQLTDDEEWDSIKWQEALGQEGEEWKKDHSYPSGLDDLVEEWLLKTTLFPVKEMDLKWIFEKALYQKGSYAYWWNLSKYRDYIQEYLPFSAFVILPHLDREPQDAYIPWSDELKKEVSSAKAQSGLDALFTFLNQESDYSNQLSFMTGLLKKRHPAYLKARDPNHKGPKAKLALSDKLLTFKVFEDLAQSRSETLHELALHFALYELSRWTEEEPLTFEKLYPFFRQGIESVQNLLLKAMSTKPSSPQERIDVSLPQFKASDLYRFCFAPQPQVRDLGLSLIAQYPDLFADPEQISLLAQSSDRRVCEGVVHILWTLLHQPETSRPWKPFAQSRSPQSAVAQRQAEVIEEYPPPGSTERSMKGKKYIGGGQTIPQAPSSEALSWTRDFLSRTIFRLSATHPYKEDLKRLTPTTASWVNKVTLIKALRDRAVQDQDFAALIYPVLAEFMASRGQAERSACLVALTRMKHAHPHLVSLLAEKGLN